MILRSFLLMTCLALSACKQAPSMSKTTGTSEHIDFSLDTIEQIKPQIEAAADYDTLIWTELTKEGGYIIDLKYATEDNFTKQIIYPCQRCFVRPKLAQKLKAVQAELFRTKQLSIKLFDCYRPKPAQQRLWDIVPDATYVADPQKGSMHNRGSAIDMTLVDNDEVELDMGTAFDHFGRESRHNYLDLDAEILANRTLLKSTMEQHGFNSIKSEWWHYSLNGTGHGASGWEWDCN